MAFPTLWSEANTAWLVFTLYFVAQYRRVQIKREGGFRYLSPERIAFVFGIALIFAPGTHISFLALTFHHSNALAIAGLCLTIAGLAFAAWARDLLGRNWSGRVIIQSGHELVTAGPYAYVRHPLYTGLLIAMFGTALISSQLGSVVGLPLALGFFMLKAQREERILEAEFGAAYATYRAQTGGLLPRFAHV
jgi:protein-S-isoprenylcysteine O-methyltransferase Ste14